MTFCSSSKVAVFSLLTIDVDLCLNMSEDLNQIYCRRSLDMNPKEAQKKVKQHQVKRTIDRLPSTFSYIFKAFIEGRKPPESSAWNRDLGRWSKIAGINPKASPKTPRKTIESWMLKAGVPEIEIYSRAGHDPVTSLRHYQSLSFTDYELRDIKKRLVEWGIFRQ